MYLSSSETLLCGTTHLTYVIMITGTTGESASAKVLITDCQQSYERVNPTMGYDKCEFCDLESTTHTATATINRHIKTEALKPRAKRGKHPGLNDKAYNRTAEYRNFRQKAESEEERKMKISTSDAKYRAKRTVQDEKKVEAAFKLLQYSPHMSRSLIMTFTFVEATRYADF